MAKILLAEDDESMRGFLTRSLTRVGHEVRSVCDGFEALPYLADGDFDLLVTDIVMPGMDGLEARAALDLGNARHEGDLHHRLCRRFAQQPRLARFRCQGALETVSPAYPGG